MYKTFGQNLVNNTCLFCGAPLTRLEQCNYCGCHYINYNQFKEELNLPDTIEVLPLTINVNNWHREDHDNCPNSLMFSYNEIDITCDYSYYELFNNLMKNYEDLHRSKKDLILLYRVKHNKEIKEIKILLKYFLINRLSVNYNNIGNILQATFVYNQLFVLQGEI